MTLNTWNSFRKAQVLHFEKKNCANGQRNREAWLDNLLSEELLRIKEYIKEDYIEVTPGYYIEGTQENYLAYTDDLYERAICQK